MKQLADAAATNGLDPVLLEVRARFVADFPLRCDRAASLIGDTAAEQTRAASADALRTLAHRLAGLAGMIGFPRVSALASDLELLADPLSGGADASDAHRVLDALRVAFTHELAGAPPSTPQKPAQAGQGHVLVAEDDDDQRALVLRHLADAGYSTAGVEAGSMVMSAARAAHPSVILLDVEMPGLDGYSACRELKADPQLANVPVVFMTSRARLDDRLVGLTLGADDYLIKPVDPRELVIRLERVRSRDAARAEHAAADGALTYEDFLCVARSRLVRSAASLILMRVPAEHRTKAVATIRDEVRRADLVAAYDRTHVVIFLPEVNRPNACTRATQLVTRLRELGIDDVVAGVAHSPAPGAIWIESLMTDADAALVQARYLGRPVLGHGETVDTPAAQPNASILVADDDPDVMRIVDSQLRGAGYRTKLAFDGAEALGMIERDQPHVVVLDLMMPKLSGFDILARLQSLATPRPRVLVLSARGREDDVTRAFGLGADDYVTKPFNPQELLARIARLLR
jgi:DNA-binding response OmpR family regulator